MIGQNINHPGWRQSFRLQADAESSRRIAFVASTNGDLTIDVVFDIQALAVPRLGKDGGSRSLGSEERELFLRDHPTLQIEHQSVTGVVAALASAVTMKTRCRMPSTTRSANTSSPSTRI